MNLNPLSTRSDWSPFTQLCLNGPKPSVYQIRLLIIYTALCEWTLTLCVPDQIAHHLHCLVWMNLNPLSTRSDWSSFTQLCLDGPKPSVYQIRLLIIYTALCEWTQTLCVPDQIAHHLHSSGVNGPKPSVSTRSDCSCIYTAWFEWTLTL